MNELCLFAGAGGGSLASKHLLGHRTVCYVEWESYCQKILQARIKDGLLDDAPIWDDVRSFDGVPWKGCVDIVTAGFPCQPFSVAGKGKAEEDERNMWPETIRIIREVGPRFCLLENVPGLLKFDYFGTILGDLAEAGFDARWKVISAADCGAPHLRKRLWIVAINTYQRYVCSLRKIPEKVANAGGVCTDVPDTQRSRRQRTRPSSMGQNAGADRGNDISGSRDVPDATRPECQSRAGGRGVRQGDTELADTKGSNVKGRNRIRRPEQMQLGGSDWWATEPDVGRVVDGVASRVDRLRAIGNGQVSAVAARAWIELNPFDNEL